MEDLEKFIDKISKLTIDGVNKWEVINQQESLEKLKNKEKLSVTFREKIYLEPGGSYLFKYKDSYIYLIKYKKMDAMTFIDKEFFILAARKNEDSMIVYLNESDDMQPQLYGLYNLIIRQTEGINDLIKDLLNE